MINYGIQQAYEVFMNNKNLFIEECLTLDIYTGTIKEIIYYIERKVDQMIELTKPDLNSNFTNS